MADTGGAALPDPKTIQKWFRRVSWSFAALGGLYLFARFSVTKTDPRVVQWPYRNVSMIVDGWPSWGRALETGDLVYYQFEGEPEPRPVVVAGLPGDPVERHPIQGADGLTEWALRIGTEIWPHGPGGALESLRSVPPDQLVLFNHAPDAPVNDCRTFGPVPMAGVRARVIWYWPSDPPKR